MLWRTEQNGSTPVNLPHLHRFVANVTNVKNLKSWLEVNSQLQSLRLFGSVLDLNILHAISPFPQLENLELSVGSIGCAGCKSNDFKSVKRFVVDHRSLKLLISAGVSLSFPQLRELEIIEKFDDTFIDFIRKNPSITKLTSSCVDSSKKKEMAELARALPSVEEIYFELGSLSPANVIMFVNECKFLKILSVKLSISEFMAAGKQSAEDVAQKNLQKRLRNEWRVSVEYYRLLKLERQADTNQTTHWIIDGASNILQLFDSRQKTTSWLNLCKQLFHWRLYNWFAVAISNINVIG